MRRAQNVRSDSVPLPSRPSESHGASSSTNPEKQCVPQSPGDVVDLASLKITGSKHVTGPTRDDFTVSGADKTCLPINENLVSSGHDHLGLKAINYINVQRKDYYGRIELLQGSVGGLSKEDETDLLIVYLRERGQYKANQDSALAALNRAGISLLELEKETKPQPSYRRHYHCWLSRPLPRPRPVGLEFKRLLVYEDPGDALSRNDTIVLDIMKCLTTVIGGDVQIRSVLIPLSGALLSPSLRKHFVRATVEVAYFWLQMGLPVHEVKILLPETDITKEIETFNRAKEMLTRSREFGVQQNINYDVFFSYAQGDTEAASDMMKYLYSKNKSIRIFDSKPREVLVRERGVVNLETTEAISQSRIFLALLSDDYFNSVECTEAFSLAYCRDFDSQGNFIIPLFWRSCDLTPLAKRLVATEGVDCREGSLESAIVLLEEILSAFENLNDALLPSDDAFHAAASGDAPRHNINIGEKLLMAKEQNDEARSFLQNQEKLRESDPQVRDFFDEKWRKDWEKNFSTIVLGPRIGAGGFGEVYKCKWDNSLVAIKTLQKIEDDDPHAVMAEFMVEMKLMSKLKHPNIVSFLGASVNAPHLAIILEFMPGGSLYRAIHRRRRNDLGPFPILKSMWIAFGIAKGLNYLHSQFPKIIHRDLKSPNILLGTNVREVKITDFGLSRLLSRTYIQTRPGGTPEWMAPELLRQDAFDEQSDIYSFGVILWELLMCEKPWKDDHPMQIVFKVGSRGEKLQSPPPDVCTTNIRDLILKCFSEDPESRPRAPEIVEILNSVCQRPEEKKVMDTSS